MKKIKHILLGLLALLLVLLLIALGFGANYLYNLALNPTTSKDMIFGPGEEDSDNVSQDETSGLVSNSDIDWLLHKSQAEDVFFTSRDGLNLHNYIIRTPDSNKWVITVHGYTSQGTAMAPYAMRFHDLGYNIVIPDLRSHGQSEGDYIGMGWDERLDILDLIQYIITEDQEAQIVLFGVSMGASTVMSVSGEILPPHVKAIIEDCGYTSVWDQFSYQLKDLFGLPPFPMMHSASLVTKLRAGYWLGEASALEQVKKSNTPTLFIHGDQDDFVPYSMLDTLYEACLAPKEKLIIQGAGHAKSMTTNPTLYWETITDFLNQYVASPS